MDGMSEKAKEARREYYKQYRKNHREQVNKRMRNWRAKHKDKVKEYNAAYWEKKIAEN